LIITRDPEEDWVNAGTYRVMVHDRDTAGIYIQSNNHGSIHMRKYFARNQPCPVAICLGAHPLLFAMGSNGIPRGTCEYDFAGGVAGRPLEVVNGPITGLPIPAGAEIVLEGEILPDLRLEGPFGEFHGYYASGARPEPVIRVKAVYHRHNPILLG